MIFYQQYANRRGPQNPALPCDREKFMEITHSPSVSTLCREVSRVAALAAAEERKEQPDAEQLKQWKEQKRKAKARLPIFFFQGNFPTGERLQKKCRLNGLYMADFDDLEEAPQEMFDRLFPEPTREQWLNDLGIELCHITPSARGLRFVAKAQVARGNLFDNQCWLAEKLGLRAKLDEGCQDANRASFAFPAENLLYLNDELFTHHDDAYEKAYGAAYRKYGSKGGKKQAQTQAAPQAASTTSPCDGTLPDGSTVITLYHGVPMATLIDQWWQQHGGIPREGERNTRLKDMAFCFRYLVDYDEERLINLLPTLDLPPEEVRSMCHSACMKEPFERVPQELAALFQAVGLTAEGEAQDNGTLSQLTAGLDREFKRLKLPRPLKIVCDGVEQPLKVGALLASLPMFYTLLTRIRFDHIDGTESRLSGMTFIVGPAASGKSFIRDLDKMLMTPLRNADEAGRRLEQEYRDKKELNKNKEEQMAKPHSCIRVVPIQISNTMLAQRMRDAVDATDKKLHLHVYTLETELATAIRASKGGSWIEKNDIYCKAFHNEMWGVDYANDQAVNGEVEVNLNLVVSGTEDAFDKLIPTSSILSGLPTRLMYFPMPTDNFKMLSRKRACRSQADVDWLTELAYKLDKLSGKVDATKLTDAMYRWGTKMAKRAEFENDIELDDLRKRTLLMGERAGVAYAILAQWEQFQQGQPLEFDTDCIRFAKFVAECCLVQQYAKFAKRMREQKQKAREYAGAYERPMRLAEAYNRLPARFTIDDLQQVRPEASRGKLTDNCYIWCHRGFIKRIGQGTYQKIIPQL